MLHATKPHRCAVWASLDPDDPEGLLVCEECGVPMATGVTAEDSSGVGRGGLVVDRLPAHLACGCVNDVDHPAPR